MMGDPEKQQITSRYGVHALHAGLARLHAHMRIQTPTRPGPHLHARAHRPKINTYCFFTATMIRESASVLRYAYIVFF
jgi:hypothetical protein